MALVTEANRTTIQETLDKVQLSMMISIELSTKMEEIKERIRDKDINDGTDWDVIVAAYTPNYDVILAKLKVVVESLPRWNVV